MAHKKYPIVMTDGTVEYLTCGQVEKLCPKVNRRTVQGRLVRNVRKLTDLQRIPVINGARNEAA